MKTWLSSCCLLAVSLSSFSSAQDYQVAYGKHQVILKSPELINQISVPVLMDDFEQGAEYAPLKKWSLYGHKPVYSQKESVSGSASGLSSFRGATYNSTAENKNIGGLSSAYLSYYFKIVHVSGNKSRNIKLARLSSDFINEYRQPIGLTFMPNHGTGQFYTYSSTGTSKVPFKWLEDYVDGQWHRAEYYVELSSPAGAANGRSQLFMDGERITDDVNVVTEEEGNKINWLTLPYYVAKDAGGDYDIYYDNVYLSKDQSRVELCKTANYSKCFSPVILNIQTLDASEAVLEVLPDYIQKAHYLFIFNKQGVRLNGEGIEICVACDNRDASTP